MQFDTFAIAIVIIMNLVLGGFVLFRNFRNKINISFAFLAFSVAVWSFFNYYTNHAPTSILLIVNQLAFTTSLIMVFAIWLFSCNFPPNQRRYRMQQIILYGLLIIAVPISLTKFNIAGVVYRPEESVTDIVTGNLYPIYLITLISFLVIIIKNFISSYRGGNAVEKSQLRFIGVGIITAFVWGAVTSAIIPALTGDWLIAKFGPVGTVVMVGGIAYAIIRHRLFDIRLVVARTLGYVLSISALAAVYGVLAFTVTDRFISSETTSLLTQQTTYTILAVILAFTFQPLKRFFDKLTNRLFYQDAYEPQSLMNELNSSLVSSLELDAIMKNTAYLIEKYIRPEYVSFYIFDTNGVGSKSFNTDSRKIASQDEIIKLVKPFSEKVVNLIDIESISSDEREFIDNYDIELFAQLTASEKNGSSLGVLVLGHKKSGSIYGSQDIKVLEIIADELVIAIQNAMRFEEIQQFNATLQKKVDDATKELKKANEKLIALDQTKDDFISMASHQLRTPLTSVKGYISMVVEGDVGKITKQQHKLLDQAFLSSQRMVYLIADLLNVSRLKTGKFIIEPKPTNLADLVEGELSQLTETAKSRDLTLNYTKPANFPLLMLDDTKIRQVVMNFADNAIYYTLPGGKIDVKVEDTGKTIEFTVTDNGIGVPKNERHNLFSKFYRANNAKRARPDGTGLGLFMAKKVIIAQGGSIIFKSEEGKGSTFGFSFDKAKLKTSDPKTDKHKLDESDTKLQ